MLLRLVTIFVTIIVLAIDATTTCPIASIGSNYATNFFACYKNFSLANDTGNCFIGRYLPTVINATCAGCFESLVTCLQSNTCLGCQSAPVAQSCLTCAETNCKSSLETCTGLQGISFLSTCSDILCGQPAYILPIIIAGSAVGGVFLLFIVFYFYRKRKSSVIQSFGEKEPSCFTCSSLYDKIFCCCGMGMSSVSRRQEARLIREQQIRDEKIERLNWQRAGSTQSDNPKYGASARKKEKKKKGKKK